MNTVEDITPNINKNPSSELISMVTEYTDKSIDRHQLHIQIMERARYEGISDDQIRAMIIERCESRGLSDRQIRRLLPDELKDKKMQAVRSHRLEYVKQEVVHPRLMQETDEQPEPEPEIPEPTTPIPTYQDIPTSIPQQISMTEIQQVAEPQPTKRQPDWKVIRNGTIPEAFQQITYDMKQFNYRTDKCKMALLIFYE